MEQKQIKTKLVAHPELLSQIEAFCAEFGIAESALGKDALGDPNYVSDLRAGRESRMATREAITAAMQRIEAASDKASQ